MGGRLARLVAVVREGRVWLGSLWYVMAHAGGRVDCRCTAVRNKVGRCEEKKRECVH